MNERVPLRRLMLGALCLSAVCYAVGFAVDQRLRRGRGPWEMTFQAGSTGGAELVIRRANAHGTPAVVRFVGEVWTNRPVTVRFDEPRRALPVGRVAYDDLTYWPGVVTVEIYGNEIEMLPRTLYVNRRAVPWGAATNLVLTVGDRPVALGEPRPHRRSPFRP